MADFNMAANMYGMYPSTYNNQVALNDLTDLDLYSPIGMANPMFGMNGSIFSGGFGSPIGNIGSIGMGMSPMMPVMPTFSGGTAGSYEDYYKNYEKYQDFMINNQVRQQQKMRNADLRLNSPQEGIARQAAILHEKIVQNEQQQIQNAYKEYLQSVKAMYGNGSADEISNRAVTLYKQLTGIELTDDIRQHGNSSFKQGLLQTLTLGFADNKTAEENISDMTGQPVGRSEKAKKIAGNLLGGAVFGGAAAIGTKYLLKAFCAGAKNKPFWAALIGGAVGLGTALVTAKSS